MSDQKRPYVWQMILEAMDALGSPTTNIAVRDWILNKYPGTNKNTITCQIIICTVNHASRVHYPENKKPRRCDGYIDFLFRPDRGKLEKYDPSAHGHWSIAERKDGALCVCRADDRDVSPPESIEAEHQDTAAAAAFAAEAHLRDYLVAHLEDVEADLSIYVDDHGADGVEYTTSVGRIDILAQDRENRFVVIELKVGHGPDAVCGQLMRYMGWVKRHLSDGRTVRGMIIAQRISDRIRYALADVPGVSLKEYELSLRLRDAEPLG